MHSWHPVTPGNMELAEANGRFPFTELVLSALSLSGLLVMHFSCATRTYTAAGLRGVIWREGRGLLVLDFVAVILACCQSFG